jgi:arylsulfatase A-like enzyme
MQNAMKTRNLIASLGLALSAVFAPAFGAEPTAGVAGSPSAANYQDRSQLPMPNTVRTILITYDAKSPDTKFPPIEQLRPPKGAPNVLIVLIDDAGFGSSSTFGGPCQTPTLEKLATGGLRYTRFHTTALCSPTRQALLTGRNHHSVGMGGITETATGAPGYSSVRPNSMAPLAETLKLNGYSTAQFGKCHEVPVWQSSPAGPFDSWPTGGGGFEYFYGFLGGEANQWYPTLYEGTTPVEIKKTPEQGYHLVADMADKAIKWIGQQKALAPDKPFFIYFAPGATHAPHHAPKAWADKYKGKFDQGYDKLREETFARQKKLGVIPADCQLTGRNQEVPAWDQIPDSFKPVLRREMEVYAGFLEYTDYHVGRIVDMLEKLKILDDTIIYYILGDNGASAEGSINGCYNEMSYFNGLQESMETPQYLTERLDKLGGPESYNHYAVGWALAMNTPCQWTKQVASHWGGTRNGTVIHWPKGIKAKGEIRSQFAHVIDVAPTVLEVAGLPQPRTVNGIQQDALEGVSMRYSFDEPNAAERHETQYFEIFGNRGIYYKGWSAMTKHRTPWGPMGAKVPAFDDDVWELYSDKDWSQANNLAQQMPEKLRDLQRQFLIEAARYKVLPLDDRVMEKINPDTAGRPVLIKGKTQLLFGGMGRLGENCVVNLKNKSHSVTAEIVVPEKGAEGVIVCQGANIGGWSLYAKNGKLKYCYNWGGFKQFYAESSDPLPAGQHQIRMEFAYAGGGLGKGGKVTLFTDGKKVGEGVVEATLAMIFSADDGCDVGEDSGAAVSPDYSSVGNAFNGEVRGVQLSIADDPNNADHLVKAEDAIKAALGRQ